MRGAAAVLHAMSRPRPAVAIEMAGFFRMPIARGKNRQASFQEFFNITIQHRYDVIAISNGEGAARAEIVLHVDHNQRIFSPHRFQL